MNMTPENRSHFELEKEANSFDIDGIGEDEIYSTVLHVGQLKKFRNTIERLQQRKFLMQTQAGVAEAIGTVQYDTDDIDNQSKHSYVSNPNALHLMERPTLCQSKIIKAEMHAGFKVRGISEMNLMNLESDKQRIFHMYDMPLQYVLSKMLCVLI
ncbi:hypothetical protein Tco_0731912 [Tanacetum coccineum]